MLYFSVFELFSGWVLLAKLFICTTPIGYFKMSPYYCGPKGNEENAYAPFFMRGGGGEGGGGLGITRPRHFLREKPWGRGWAVMKVSGEFAAYISSYTLEWD